MRKAIIAMSGGVDSSVAALLTKETGDECIGATMKLFHNEDIGVKREKTCCSLDDVEDARNVCYRMGIRYYVFNFSERFKEDVMDRFVDAYEHGCTNRYETAEYLEVTEEFLEECISCYREKYGVCKIVDNYIIYFIPNLAVFKRI